MCRWRTRDDASIVRVGFDAKKLDKAGLISNAEIAGTVPMWEWIGDEGATTFTY